MLQRTVEIRDRNLDEFFGGGSIPKKKKNVLVLMPVLKKFKFRLSLWFQKKKK